MSTTGRSESQIERVPHSRDDAFWRENGGVGLVWSNGDASDEIMIINALLRPSFHLLLNIAARFGFRRLVRQWEALKKQMEESELPEERAQIQKVTSTVERCIAHMEEGIRQSERSL